MPIIYSSRPLQPRQSYDNYPTPPGIIEAALSRLQPRLAEAVGEAPVIVDPGAGEGIWGQVARRRWPKAIILGVEVRDLPCPAGYDEWYVADYLHWHPPVPVDLVLGNPPFRVAEPFLEHSFELLSSSGYLLFLLRLAFLESRKRYLKYYHSRSARRPEQVWVSTRRLSFTGDGKTDATAYALYLWRGGVRGFNTTNLSWLDWA